MLETATHRIKLTELKLLDKNARFMTSATFHQLVANIKKDGCLTSAPLVWRCGEDQFEVLSGNHRVQAAIQAGVEFADVIEVTSPLTREQRVALQLSHNAITGEDDPSVLADLWAELDFDMKQYSGVTEADFGGLAKLDTASLGIQALKYEQLTISFLPHEMSVFLEIMKKIEAVKGSDQHVLASLDDFTAFFDTLIAVKSAHNVHNGAIALRIMAQLAQERLTERAAMQADG